MFSKTPEEDTAGCARWAETERKRRWALMEIKEAEMSGLTGGKLHKWNTNGLCGMS